MATNRIRTRPPRAAGREPAGPPLVTDDVSGFLEDAAHYSGGHAPAVAFPRDEAEVAALVRRSARVLPVGAQSSLTGGATPMGELVLSSSRMNAVGHLADDRVTVQPGVALTTLRETLDAAGKAYPPVPTFEGATIGGVVSTNAAGAATFKHGTTRDWVRGLTVVLASGEALDLERGQVRAADGRFVIETAQGEMEVPAPTHRLPRVPKHSAGYHAGPDLDLVDLFVGSEGTLGVVTSVTLDVLPRRPEIGVALIALDGEEQAIALAARLRDVSLDTRRRADPAGLDVAAIEYLDRRSLELARAAEAGRGSRVSIPEPAGAVLLVQIELPPGTTAGEVHEQIGLAASAAAPGPITAGEVHEQIGLAAPTAVPAGPITAGEVHEQIGLATSAAPSAGPIVQLCRLLEAEDLLDRTELAAPGETARAAQLLAFREAVPEAVNRQVAVAKRTVDGTIEKTAADMIVPFSKLSDFVRLFRAAFEARGLDHAVWGHLSDANLHPNVIPRSADDVRAGKEAILACGREVVRLGGCPLAEHGVGRNPVKQALLRLLHGDAGIEQMRAVKRALDPENKLAPGVLFPAPGGRKAPA